MRSTILALALAATGSAFAATPNFTNPIHTMHQDKPGEVYLTFVNNTAQERTLTVNDFRYVLGYGKSVHMSMRVGSQVQVTSNQNSRVNEIMQVWASDSDKTVNLK